MSRRLAALLFALPLTLPLTMPLMGQVAPPDRGPGPVAIATTAQIAPVLRAIAAAYRAGGRGGAVTIDVVGSDVAMARLYSGRADVAVIGREAADPEIKAYEWAFRHPPAARTVMRGSVAMPGHSPDLAVRVAAANPLRTIALADLRAVLRARDAVTTWRGLGVGGVAGGRTIHLVIPDAESGTGRFLRAALMAGAPQFDWPRVREIAEPVDPAGHDDRFGAAIARAAAADPTALGLGDAAPVPGTRIVAVTVAGKVYRPGDEGYPLARRVRAYADPAPRPAVATWLDFAAGPEATAIIRASAFRPPLAEQ